MAVVVHNLGSATKGRIVLPGPRPAAVAFCPGLPEANSGNRLMSGNRWRRSFVAIRTTREPVLPFVDAEMVAPSAGLGSCDPLRCASRC